MALTRYRHFWQSKLELAPVHGAGSGDLGGSGEVSDVDITGILKSYSPPRIVREVRQVETGKYLNERILGRLMPEETNFSITMPSDFEVFYAYNHDYQFEIVEELHSNVAGVAIRYVIDEVRGTLFDREWTDFTQAGGDRDVTLHFILKNYVRLFSNDVTGSDPVKVFEVTAGLDTGVGEFKTRGLDVSMTTPRRNADGDLVDANGMVVQDEADAAQDVTGTAGLVDMFRGNYGVQGTDTNPE